MILYQHERGGSNKHLQNVQALSSIFGLWPTTNSSYVDFAKHHEGTQRLGTFWIQHLASACNFFYRLFMILSLSHDFKVTAATTWFFIFYQPTEVLHTHIFLQEDVNLFIQSCLCFHALYFGVCLIG